MVSTYLGPLATILAAAAAVFVIWRIGQAQVRIAESQAQTARAQRDIAFDGLKHDLFEKRYEIYTAAKGIMERVIRIAVRDKNADSVWIGRLDPRLNSAVVPKPPTTLTC